MNGTGELAQVSQAAQPWLAAAGAAALGACLGLWWGYAAGARAGLRALHAAVRAEESRVWPLAERLGRERERAARRKRDGLALVRERQLAAWAARNGSDGAAGTKGATTDQPRERRP